MRRTCLPAIVPALLAFGVGACSCEDESTPPACSVRSNGDGSHTVSCTDGTEVTVRDGRDGVSCTAEDLGTHRLVRCTDGTEVTLPRPEAAGCTVEPLEDGGARVSCDDGTQAVLPPGRDGQSCTVVRTLQGERVVQCADGTSIPLADGADGGSCTVGDNLDGTYTIRCDDGTTATVSDGAPGGGCSVSDDGAGTKTIRCGDGTEVQVRDGTDGGACSVLSNGDGTTTITCPDGTTATISDGADGSSCSVLDNGDGTFTISCEDGTSVTVWPGAAGAGAIHGMARLLGRDDHAGISVTVDGLGLTTTTDAAGEYRLAGVPAGMHALAFEFPGYTSRRQDGVTVLPGTYEAVEVTLRIGRRIDTGSLLLPLAGSADGDALVAIRYQGLIFDDQYSLGRTAGEALLFDLRDGAVTPLAGRIGRADFTPDGRTIVLQEHSAYGAATYVVDRATLAQVELPEPRGGPRGYLLGGALLWGIDSWGDLVAVSLPGGASTTIGTAVDAESIHATEDGLALAFLDQAWAGSSLHWFDAASGSVTQLAAEVNRSTVRYARGGRVVAFERLVRPAMTRELVVVDTDAGFQRVVGAVPAGTAATLSRDGRWLAYRDESGEVVTWDVAAGAAGASTLGAPVEFEAAGSRLLVCRAGGTSECDLLLFEPPSGTETLIAAGTSSTALPERFSPDGRYVAFLVAGRLWLWDSATRAAVGGPAGVRERSVRFSPDGARVVAVQSASLGSALQAVELPSGVVSELDHDVSWEALAFSADGGWLLYGGYPAYYGNTAVVSVWDFATGTGRELGRRAVLVGGFGPDWRRAVVLSSFDSTRRVGTLSLFDTATGEHRVLDRQVRVSPVQFAGRIAYELRALYLPEREDNGLYVAELP